MIMAFISRLGFCRLGVVRFVLVFGLLALGLGLLPAAQSYPTYRAKPAKATTPPAWQIKGAVKLKASDTKKVEKVTRKGVFVQCGLLPTKRFPKGRWVSGTIIAAGPSKGWFLALAKEADNLKAKSISLKKAGETTQAEALISLSNNKKALSAKGNNTCSSLNAAMLAANASGNASGSASGSGSGSAARLPFDRTVRWVPFTRTRSSCESAGAPGTNELRLSLCSKEGVVRVGSSRRGRPRPRSGSSDIKTFDSNGALADAVTEGSISVAVIAVGPTGWTYMGLNSPVNLTDTSSGSGTLCAFIRVNEATGVPACVDPSVRNVSEIQFDATVGVYYKGSNVSGTGVLRSYVDGVVTNLVTSSSTISHFAVTSDGTVVMSGQTSGGSGWVRWVDSSGTLHNIFSTNEATFVRLFPDGNIYIGIWSTSNRMGVNRFLAATKTLDNNLWISGNVNNQQVTPYWAADEICRSVSPQDTFCGNYGTYVSKWQVTQSGKVIALTSAFPRGRLMEYWPEVKYLNTAVSSVQQLAPAGSKFVVSGTNDVGQNILTLYDPETDSEQMLIGPANETEIYNLTYASSNGEIFFDGLRFSNNTYVVGKVNVVTRVLTYLGTTTTAFSSFQAF
jgi:hypothetical protein